MSNIISVGGRQFKPCTDSTIEHDVRTVDLADAAGLRDLQIPAEGSADDYQRFVHELITGLVRNRHLFSLLGCVLIPADKEPSQWTPELGEETAAFLASCTSPDDKQLIYAQTAALLEGFFVAGLATRKITRSFSSVMPGNSDAAGPGKTEAPSITASGPTLSASLPGTTTTNTSRSFVGRCAKRFVALLRG